MKIAILSEIDSRIVLYPLLKCLQQYGSIRVYSSNVAIQKFAENCNNVFENIEIYADASADLETLLEETYWHEEDQTFTIFDNIGATEYDAGLVVVSAAQSPDYISDVLYTIANDNTTILKMGKPYSEKSKAKTATRDLKKLAEDDDPDYNKWAVEESDQEILDRKLRDANSRWIPMITLEDILRLETMYKFFKPNSEFAKVIYPIVKKVSNVDERDYLKGVERINESSNNIDTVVCR